MDLPKSEPETMKRKRGRPAAASLVRSLEDVSEITGVAVEVIERLLEKVPGTIPGAFKGEDGWRVPERGLRAILGAPTGPLPQFATVAEVAECLRRKPKTVYNWLGMRRAGGDEPLLPHKEILGTVLIPVAAVLSLPARMPGPRPSFFCRKEAARADG
jgi:hypothetical protein